MDFQLCFSNCQVSVNFEPWKLFLLFTLVLQKISLKRCFQLFKCFPHCFICAGTTSIPRTVHASSSTMEAAKGTKTTLKAFRLVRADVRWTFPFPLKKILGWNFASWPWMKAPSKFSHFQKKSLSQMMHFFPFPDLVTRLVRSKDGIMTVLMAPVKNLNTRAKKATGIAF